jgi:hypothetical protein
LPPTVVSASTPAPVAQQMQVSAAGQAATSPGDEKNNSVRMENSAIVASNAPTPVGGPSGAAASPQEVAVPSTHQSTSAVMAANNVAEPAPPAEESNANSAVAAAQQPSDETDTVSQDSQTSSSADSAVSARKSSASRTPKPHTRKSPTVTQSKAHSVKPRVPRALPADAEPPPAHGGTMRAQVVGVTPNGNVILALPSGERAIVSPQDADQYPRSETSHRRTRRVIIERRTILVPPPQLPTPYQPFIPPDA